MLTKTRDTIILSGLVLLLALLMSWLSTYINHHNRQTRFRHNMTIYTDDKNIGHYQLTPEQSSNGSDFQIQIFSQDLLDSDMKTIIGHNEGYCIGNKLSSFSRDGKDIGQPADGNNNQFSHCNLTLVFDNTSRLHGRLFITSRDTAKTNSTLAIIGGTEDFQGVTGTMAITPITLDDSGILFRQVLSFK
jgi:hypothetical protein